MGKFVDGQCGWMEKGRDILRRERGRDCREGRRGRKEGGKVHES